MSIAQFKKRTTHLDIPGKAYDLYQLMVKTGPCCNPTKPRPDRSRVSGLGAEQFGDLIFLDHGLRRNGDKTFGFHIQGGATSHLTAYPCKSTSSSEVISKLHEWMDTFQMNPKAICADMACHHPHYMQAFDGMHNMKRPPLPGQIELRWVFDYSRSFSVHLWIQPRKIRTRPLYLKSHLPS